MWASLSLLDALNASGLWLATLTLDYVAKVRLSDWLTHCIKSAKSVKRSSRWTSAFILETWNAGKVSKIDGTITDMNANIRWVWPNSYTTPAISIKTISYNQCFQIRSWNLVYVCSFWRPKKTSLKPGSIPYRNLAICAFWTLCHADWISRLSGSIKVRKSAVRESYEDRLDQHLAARAFLGYWQI